jgi:hypothetical protein
MKWWLLALVAVVGCTGTLPPLRHELEPGQDAYLIFEATGPDGLGELYASSPVGEKVIAVTFTPVAELAPALSPDGVVIAFLRAGQPPNDSASRRIWALNLLNGAERRLKLPDSAGTPRALGWSHDGKQLYVRTDDTVWVMTPPPGSGGSHRLTSAERSAAVSALGTFVGRPAFARIVSCDSTAGLCVRVPDGSEQPLAAGAHDPAAWGADSVAYFLGDEVEIRPLGPGHPRVLRWSRPPRDPHWLNYFAGTGSSDTPAPPPGFR